MPDATRPAPPRPRPIPVHPTRGPPSIPPPNQPGQGTSSHHEQQQQQGGQRSGASSSGTGAGGQRRSAGGHAGEVKPPAKTIRIGQYELGATLGVGSFGKVKLATHSMTGHKVAMKIINRRKIQHMEMTSRVKREIQYLKVLRHPHIIKLYEVITTSTDIIMVIEYAGQELFEYIVNKGRMEEDEARRFFQQIICAIEYCHRHKIVHRDLKPENLLLDDYLNVKIGDFGLSNIMTDGDFLKTSCGSPNYAAPEVISGKLYAGPEIDIWSCGVILYVMLCGRLPFDDDYIPKLFQKINGGIYHLPSHLSEDARFLLKNMLVVDPVKRITTAGIRQSAWFQKNLPQYLQPLPSTPGLEGPDQGDEMSSLLGGQGQVIGVPADGNEISPEEQLARLAEGTSQGLIHVPDLGVVEPRIVDELCEKMAGFDRGSIWDALKKEGDNQIKVAYQLVRDHKRMLQDTADMRQDNGHVMESFLASSPPPWNAGLESQQQGVNRSTSIKHRASTKGANDEESWDEDDDMEMEDIPDSNFQILDSSLHGKFDENGEPFPAYDAPPFQSQSLTSQEDAVRAAHQAVAAQRAAGRSSKSSKGKWHFGIRSRSPPIEVMHEIYNTLQVLGMQWKRKQCFDGPWDQDGRPIRNPPPGQTREQKQKERVNEEKQNQALFFVETRCKIDDVVVRIEFNGEGLGWVADLPTLAATAQIRMDLQLYRVDSSNYLVDFRNVGYYRSNNDPDDYALYRRPSDATDHTVAESLESRRSSLDGITIASPLKREAATTITGGPGNETVEGKIKEVCSPFLFLEVACRLIVELASA